MKPTIEGTFAVAIGSGAELQPLCGPTRLSADKFYGAAYNEEEPGQVQIAGPFDTLQEADGWQLGQNWTPRESLMEDKFGIRFYRGETIQ